MRRTKQKNKILILLILLLVITIGYAILSTTLKINGTANISKPSWNIYWTNQEVTMGSVSQTLPTIEEDENDPLDTKISWSVTLNSLDDYYEFTVDAVNEGSIDAMVSSISKEITDVNNNAITLPDYLEYIIKYDDNKDVTINDVLATNTKQKYRVRVKYNIENMTKEEIEAIPDEGQLYNFSYKVVYSISNGEIKKSPLRLGEYFIMNPDKEIATTTYEGFTGNTPTEDQNLWRVIKLNRDGTVDAISHYVSTNNITISSTAGYENFIKGLQDIASCYTKEGYTTSTRMMGYNGQTEVLKDTYIYNGVINKVPKTSSIPSPTTGAGEEYKEGILGDTLYLNDYQLVKNTYSNVLSAKTKTGTTKEYWLASRYYRYSNSNSYYFSGRTIYTNSNLSYKDIRYLSSSNWNNSSPSCAVRPIITLNNELTIKSGKGSLEEPYNFD